MGIPQSHPSMSGARWLSTDHYGLRDSFKKFHLKARQTRDVGNKKSLDAGRGIGDREQRHEKREKNDGQWRHR